MLFALTLALVTTGHLIQGTQDQPAVANPMITTAKIHTQSGEETQVIQAITNYLNANQTAVATMGPGQVTELAVIPPYAVGKFVRGPVGGHVVLKHQTGQWQIVTKRDDWGGLKAFVNDFGIPEEIAVQLLDQVFPNWRQWER